LQHDLPDRADTMSEAFPHLLFHNFSSALGTRVMTVLKCAFYFLF
jgi:U3 small nucleolar ribonucleoprotein protein IMP4